MDTNTVTPTQGEEAHEEEIHMPPPSWSPIILALGMTSSYCFVGQHRFVPLAPDHPDWSGHVDLR
jgi:hypothetical protein